ncbi:hypothetical protein SLS62_000221 [Diatrype stigma]|uniref:VPS37 C-terminal domain-containing protein n=1 Tax=Diatrype stigma TaxID=117547 RepID=A0AAN9V0K1_9PEZI
MYGPPASPPIPPPKPSSHEASRLGTPSVTNSPRPPPPPPFTPEHGMGVGSMDARGRGFAAIDSSGLILAPGGGSGAQQQYQQQRQQPQPIPDPGEHWLPKILEDKSKQDLAEILGSPELLEALTHAPSTRHPSLAATEGSVDEGGLLPLALEENENLARHLAELESRLALQREAAQAQLLSAHALERQWRQKQAQMDEALAPFAPAALYHRLTRALQEQEMVCRALEESFLEGGGGEGDLATERETLEWVRRYRDARKLFYLRQERKERWNERRVGGWR